MGKHHTTEPIRTGLFLKIGCICFTMMLCWFLLFDKVNQLSVSSVAQSCLQLVVTPWTAAHPDSLSITNSQSLLKLMLTPLSQWCPPTISSSVVPFSSWPQSFPASGSFPMSQFFASGGQSIGASASASVLPVNQLYAYIYYLPVALPWPLPIPTPSRPPQSTQMSSLCYVAGSHQLSVLYMTVHIRQSPNSPPPPRPCISSPCLCPYSCPGTRSICTTSQDSTYRH